MDKYLKARAFLMYLIEAAEKRGGENGLKPRGIDELGTALDAVNKQIEQDVIMVTEDDREFEDYVCPNCKTTLEQLHKNSKKEYITGWPNCQHCGQKIKNPFHRKPFIEKRQERLCDK